MEEFPTGTVTFLFTDIEGSTQLLQRTGDERGAEVFAAHRRLLRAAFEAGQGHELETQGDGFLVVFQSARDAVLTAVEGLRAVNNHQWPEDAVVRVRMGVHTGEPVRAGEGYSGLGVHRAARICTAGWGGQILLSQVTTSLVQDDPPTGIGLRDLGSHRLKDLQKAEKIFQVLHPALPADFPPLRTLNRFPNNLPVQLTNFIGREREMQEVNRLLSKNRLLTVTGSGGLGKTRLALQVAAELADTFADGVWLVELASISDPDLIPQAVASALGVRERPGLALMITLADYLNAKHLLLVLDNCEHLIAACAQLADALLRSCPHLHLLATSRQALGIIGETSWRTPPLSSPNPQHLPPPERLPEYEAVRLFNDRAAAALPDFVVTPRNAPAVAQVCYQLDGIPLAIELAAVRMKVLSVEQIAQRLDDRFRLLTGGSRTALPRQQTLRAVLEWSHSLLSEGERSLFRRLSVFAGGCTLEGVETVCPGVGGDPDDVLDLVAQLVDKSLLVVDSNNSDLRYRMLETIRLFAWEKLLESGEEVGVRRRHQDFFLMFAERAEPQLRGPEQAIWLQHLEVEHENMRAALNWSVEYIDSEAGLRLAGALWLFWSVRGYYHEGRGWLEEVLRRSGGASPASRAKALGGAGYVATSQLDYAAAQSLLEESLAIRQQIGDRSGIADSLYGLGRVAWRQEDFARAAAFYKEALALFEELGSRNDVARLLNSLGVLTGSQGDHATARSFFEKSLALQRQLGNIRGIAFAAGNLGVMASRQGDYAAARALLTESLAIDRELGDRRGCVSELEEVGLLAAAQGRAARAARLLGAAKALRETIGAPLSPSERSFYAYDHYVAAIAAALGQEAFATAWAEGRAISLEQAIEYAMGEDE